MGSTFLLSEKKGTGMNKGKNLKDPRRVRLRVEVLVRTPASQHMGQTDVKTNMQVCMWYTRTRTFPSSVYCKDMGVVTAQQEGAHLVPRTGFLFSFLRLTYLFERGRENMLSRAEERGRVGEKLKQTLC